MALRWLDRWHAGVRVGEAPRSPSTAWALMSSALWIVVALPFAWLAWTYSDWPRALFVHWQGWIFGAAAVACMAMATVVPARWRLRVLGTRLRGWGRLL